MSGASMRSRREARTPRPIGCARIKHMFAPMNERVLALILLGALAVSGAGCRGTQVGRPVAPAEATLSTGSGGGVADPGTAVESNTVGGARSATEASAPPRRPARPVVAPGTIFKRVSTDQRLIALTFDDGPSPNLHAVLDALSRADARATFFVVGERCAGHDALLCDIVASGNELANHSWDHQEVDGDPSTGEIVRSLARTSSRLDEATQETPTLFRPPAGKYDGRLAGITEDLGLATALWDIHSGDTNGDSAGRIAATVLGQAHPGGIVLMHETAPATVEALPTLIDGLRARGYRLVTVSELLAAGRAVEVAR